MEAVLQELAHGVRCSTCDQDMQPLTALGKCLLPGSPAFAWVMSCPGVLTHPGLLSHFPADLPFHEHVFSEAWYTLHDLS
ncbi:hypothetical protein TREES_T100013299 [Tupaia chinensis]|uniref:Uncharacterized protein n=1 Tax=Tupaia chinensis TaxID=246437 RepID=L9KKH7_TUPCH|nr:hypothetical protein TREES_T100013299 [Tupaia chinensis]